MNDTPQESASDRPPQQYETHLIDALGGTAAVAALFERGEPSISRWRKEGIPRDVILLMKFQSPVTYARWVEDWRNGVFDQPPGAPKP